jgi:hypothetical protein
MFNFPKKKNWNFFFGAIFSKLSQINARFELGVDTCSTTTYRHMTRQIFLILRNYLNEFQIFYHGTNY